MGPLNVTAHALVSLETLWQRQQGGALAPAGIPAAGVELELEEPRPSGSVAGASDSPASDAPAAPKPKKPRAPYKRSKNGRRTSKVPRPKRRQKK
jgi:hypothetical protein